jgi:uncharacterized lipoprotein YehR (DUF1307 family)
MEMAARIFAVLAVLLVSGCGQDNPYLGVWESEPVMGISEKMEFKNSSVAGSGKEVNVTYKIEKTRIGIVTKHDGNEVTSWFNIVDQNTLSAEAGMGKFIYHRK